MIGQKEKKKEKKRKGHMALCYILQCPSFGRFLWEADVAVPPEYGAVEEKKKGEQKRSASHVKAHRTMDIVLMSQMCHVGHVSAARKRMRGRGERKGGGKKRNDV